MAFRLIHRRFMCSKPEEISTLKRVAYKLSGFNKYGLMRDDCLDEDDPDVKEALKRLPEHLVDERNYRVLRAVQLSISKSVMPKNEWTKIEDDKLYLTPLVNQVRMEREEREEWERNN